MIRIVHLSDLHFCSSDLESTDPFYPQCLEWTSPFYPHLLCDILSHGAPDIVAITGDLTTCGDEEGFRAAEQWIDELARKARLPEGRVFLVPGNHDVDRSAGLPAQGLDKLSVDHSRSLAGRCLKAHSKVWSDRHTQFLALMNKYLSEPSESPWWYRRVQIDEHWVSLLGLCSTWLSGIDDLGPDKGRLCVGWPQLESCRDFRDSALKLALIHHPWSYLADHEEVYVSHMVSKYCDIVLRGHRHRQATREMYTPDCSLLELEAGACGPNGEAPAAYQCIEFDTEEREAKVHYRVWKEHAQEWGPDRNIYGAVSDKGTALYYLPPDLVERRKEVTIEDSRDKNTRTITIPSRDVETTRGTRQINPLTASILCEMIHAIKDSAPGTTILITGEGSQFCSGLDTDVMQDKGTPQGQLTLFYKLLHVIDAHPPVVALINGPAVAGGAGIALFAHFAVACESARIEIPSSWEYRLLARTLIPFVQYRRKPGKELFKDFLDPDLDEVDVTVEFDASTAKKEGLIDEVCQHADQLEATAMKVLAEKHFDHEAAWRRFRDAVGKKSLTNLKKHCRRVSGKKKKKKN